LSFWIYTLVAVIKIALMLFVLLTAVAYIVWLERKVVGRHPEPVGPTRVGPFGLLPTGRGRNQVHPEKEDLTLPHVYKPLFIAAPNSRRGVRANFNRPDSLWKQRPHPGLRYPSANYGREYGSPDHLGITSVGVYGSPWRGGRPTTNIRSGQPARQRQMISMRFVGLSLIGVLILGRHVQSAWDCRIEHGHFWGFIPNWNIFHGRPNHRFLHLPDFAYAETNRIPSTAEAETESSPGITPNTGA